MPVIDLTLECGHVAAPRERLRFGPEKWCDTCCCWRLVAGAAPYCELPGCTDDGPVEQTAFGCFHPVCLQRELDAMEADAARERAEEDAHERAAGW
jgi:hypothetical protein